MGTREMWALGKMDTCTTGYWQDMWALGTYGHLDNWGHVSIWTTGH